MRKSHLHCVCLQEIKMDCLQIAQWLHYRRPKQSSTLLALMVPVLRGNSLNWGYSERVNVVCRTVLDAVYVFLYIPCLWKWILLCSLFNNKKHSRASLSVWLSHCKAHIIPSLRAGWTADTAFSSLCSTVASSRYFKDFILINGGVDSSLAFLCRGKPVFNHPFSCPLHPTPLSHTQDSCLRDDRNR